MLPRRKSPPSYRLHKPTGQAVVRLNGKDYYLRRHGTGESKDAYDRLIAEWLASGRNLPTAAPDPRPPARGEAPAPASCPGPRVKDILIAYLDHAPTYYRGRDGKPTPELDNLTAALEPVKRLCGETAVASFGPLALRAVRQSMIDGGLSRKVINARINRIRRCFRWVASVERIDASIVHALETLEPLQPGRSEATERSPVQPVAPLGRSRFQNGPSASAPLPSPTKTTAPLSRSMTTVR